MVRSSSIERIVVTARTNDRMILVTGLMIIRVLY